MAAGQRQDSLKGWLISFLTLLVVSVGSNVYLSLKMAENSRVFGQIYSLLEEGMSDELVSVLTTITAIRGDLELLRTQIDSTAGGLVNIDQQMRAAEDRLVERMKQELPPLLDQQLDEAWTDRAAELRQTLGTQGVRDELRQDIRAILREEIAAAVPNGGSQ